MITIFENFFKVLFSVSAFAKNGFSRLLSGHKFGKIRISWKYRFGFSDFRRGEKQRSRCTRSVPGSRSNFQTGTWMRLLESTNFGEFCPRVIFGFRGSGKIRIPEFPISRYSSRPNSNYSEMSFFIVKMAQNPIPVFIIRLSVCPSVRPLILSTLAQPASQPECIN